MSPLTLPHNCPKAIICVVELTLFNGTKEVIISCYLPQTVEAHSNTCAALAQLPHTLPHPLIILGGDLQGGWEQMSPKDVQIAALPYKRWAGPTLPTFTSRQQPVPESCIDHLTIWDAWHISRQAEDTITAQNAFLDHQGVMGTLHLPITPTEALLVLPLARPPRVPLFRYPIPEPILEGWKSKVAMESCDATSLAKAMGHSLIASLGHEPGISHTDDTIDPRGIASSIIGLANDIQAILGDALAEATTTFPHKPHAILGKGTLPPHLWPKSVRHDDWNIRRRAKAVRRLIKHETNNTGMHSRRVAHSGSLSATLASSVNTPLSLRTISLTRPSRNKTLWESS